MEYIITIFGYIIKYGLGILGLLIAVYVSLFVLQGVLFLTFGMLKKENRELVNGKWLLFALMAFGAIITIYCGVCNVLHLCFGFKDLPLTRLPSRYSW